MLALSGLYSAASRHLLRHGYDLVAEYSDDGGKRRGPGRHSTWLCRDAVTRRGNGVRTVIVETASRFARDLLTQETGWRFLRDAGITFICSGLARRVP
jgi:hypothetical protein